METCRAKKLSNSKEEHDEISLERRLNEGFSLKFAGCCLDQHTAKEGRSTQRLKRCDKNTVVDISHNVNSVKLT